MIYLVKLIKNKNLTQSTTFPGIQNSAKGNRTQSVLAQNTVLAHVLVQNYCRLVCPSDRKLFEAAARCFV